MARYTTLASYIPDRSVSKSLLFIFDENVFREDNVDY